MNVRRETAEVLECSGCHRNVGVALSVTEANVAMFNPRQDELNDLLGLHCVECFSKRKPEYAEQLKELERIFLEVEAEQARLTTQDEMHRLYGND